MFILIKERVPMKTTDLAKGQGGYFNVQAENTNFISISSDDIDRQSVSNENPATPSQFALSHPFCTI
jgi:hypothetical protein